MSKQIFYRETSKKEEWVRVNDNGTVTYETENAGWRFQRQGPNNQEETMSAEDAKQKFPHLADKIDQALAEINSN